MRILNVASWPCLPPAHGGATRVYNLLSHLSRRHEVRQFGLARSGQRGAELAVRPGFRMVTHASLAAELLGRCSARVWGTRSVLTGAALRVARPAMLDDLLEWADVALVMSPWPFAFCRHRRRDLPLVLCEENVEHTRMESFARLHSWRVGTGRRCRFVEAMEADAVHDAERIVVVSPADRDELVAYYEADPSRIVVVPNGADTQRFAPVDAERKAVLKRELGLAGSPVVAFLASGFPTNVPALGWVQRLASRASGLTFVVVGSITKRGRSGNVVATGFVDDVVPYLQAADLAVCPIEYGGGTKIKLFESLAAGLPTVTFAECLIGTELRPGEHLLVAEKDERALQDALELLAHDKSLARQLATAGRGFVVERHDWAQGAAVLDATLRELVSARAPARVAAS